MIKQIFGRDKEIAILKKIAASKEAEFVAIYGRRRVGKTYLIREFFSHNSLYCEFVGLKNGTLKEQLQNFSEAFGAAFHHHVALKVPQNWREAFSALTDTISKIPKSRKITLFFDELPWMATPKSGLIQNLDYFWNHQWSRFSNLKIILCGSAASWILENLINAKGGLYNRVTKILLLEPFSLSQTKAFLSKHGVKLNDQQILDLYMVMGGIPHYLKQVQKGLSAAQNINQICFQKDGVLYDEFERLFKSLFDESEIYLSIVRAIAKQAEGIERTALLKMVGAQSGGRFNQRLAELEASGFIQSFIPYGHKVKDQYYRIIDEYTLFYFKWMEPFKSRRLKDQAYWINKINTGAWLNWAGRVFENVCYKHIEQIRAALHLEKIDCVIGHWRHVSKENKMDQGAQIDLLFDRADKIISICEIKYSTNQFTIDKFYANQLIQKMTVFEKQLQKNKHLMLHFITTHGIAKNLWSSDLVQSEIRLKDLMVNL